MWNRFRELIPGIKQQTEQSENPVASNEATGSDGNLASSIQEIPKNDLLNTSQSIIRIPDDSAGRRESPEYKESRIQIHDKKQDHKGYKVFVEMDVLTEEILGDGKKWTESARWIKYEEDVEEESNRWGKPHVPSLSFHSLTTLLGLLETGVVLLDLYNKELPSIASRIVKQMKSEELIRNEQKNAVLKILLLKHTHFSGGKHGKSKPKNAPSLTNLQAYSMVSIQQRGSTSSKLNDPNPSFMGQPAKASGSGSLVPQASLMSVRPVPEASHMALDVSKFQSTRKSGVSDEDIRWARRNENLLKRIPPGSEVALILVGTVDGDILQKPATAFVRLAEGVYMPNVTEVAIPVRFIFLLLGPPTDEMDYKEIGRSMSTLMSNIQFHNIAYKATARKHLLRGINEFLDSSIIFPPGDWDYDDQRLALLELRERSKAIEMSEQRRSLSDSPEARESTTPLAAEKRSIEVDRFKRTKKLFGGLRGDIRRRYPLYLSDIKDGLNTQCLATISFLYFSALSSTIAFGGLLDNKTEKYVGIPETLLGTAIGGVIVALFGGQPLLLFGTTGVSMTYDESLFNFCKTEGLSGMQYLAIRSWIGFWVVIIGLLFVAFEGSIMVRFYTRFTQEIYGTFVSSVFITESVKNLRKIFKNHPIQKTYGECVKVEPLCRWNPTTDRFKVQTDEDHQPNRAILSLILTLGTFFLVNSFKKFRHTSFLNNTVRKIIGNFAVCLSIMLMFLLDFLLMKDTETANVKLSNSNLSSRINPTLSDVRGWFISPFEGELPAYWIIAAVIPALLLFILLFMESSIAELIVEKKEYKLKKGSGFHLTLMVVCVVNMINGYLGMNWTSAAAVRCMTHALALTVYSTNNLPGEKPIILGVKEQRVTSLVVSILIGLSVLIAFILVHIPMGVFYGVFLYLGFSALTGPGPQLPQRVMLLFKPSANHPQVLFVRRVRTLRMHLYTGIQVLCLLIFWGIKESPAALSLPLVTFLLLPLRLKILPFIFDPLELAALDADGLELPEPKQKPKPAEEIQDKETKVEEVNEKNNEIPDATADFTNPKQN